MKRLQREGQYVGSFANKPKLNPENALIMDAFLLMNKGRQNCNSISNESISSVLDAYGVGQDRLVEINLIRKMDSLVVKRIHA